MKLGLCCISEILKDQGFAFKTMTRKSFLASKEEYSKKKLYDICINNLQVLSRILDHCQKSGISHYRISSSMFPCVTDPQCNISIEWLESFELIDKLFDACSQKIKNYNLTISSHPNQYVVLASLNQAAVENSIIDLNFHGWMHNKLGLPQDFSNPINIHIGISSYQPIEIYNNFLKNYYLCDDSVTTRLVLENDDKGFWNYKNLYDFFGDLFCLTYDNLHAETNQSSVLNHEYWIDKYSETWRRKKQIPIFHWSEGGANGKPRSHVDYFSRIPNFVVDNPQIIWECETKAKDKAILKILKK